MTLFSMVVAARVTDNQVNYKIDQDKIGVTTNAGFHLNAEAPASAKFDDLKAIFKPDPKTEKLFVFAVPTNTKKAKLSFYVCDDKKTVCEQHQKEIVLDGKATKTSFVEAPLLTLADLKSNKMTLLIFTAPWCPACLRMQTETYPQKSVASQLKRLNVKKINIDLAENVELSEKFHVKAIPTLVLLNKEGEELTRWLDFQPAKKFATDLKTTMKMTTTISELEKKARAGDKKAISQRGMLAFLAYNCEETIKWLSMSNTSHDLNYKLAAEIQCAEGEGSEKQIQALEKAISLTTSKLDKIRWSADLFELKKEGKQKIETFASEVDATLVELKDISKNESTLKKAFTASTYGDPAGFANEEALLLKARLFGVLEKGPEKQIALDAIKINADKHNISVDRPGEMLLAIAYLREAGEKVRVQEMYQQLLNAYPNTYVYHEKYSRYQHKNKNYDQALNSVNSALQFSEGNEPQLHLLKANILNDMKNKEQALVVVNEALQLENISHKKFKKTLALIQSLKMNLQK